MEKSAEKERVAAEFEAGVQQALRNLGEPAGHHRVWGLSHDSSCSSGSRERQAALIKAHNISVQASDSSVSVTVASNSGDQRARDCGARDGQQEIASAAAEDGGEEEREDDDEADFPDPALATVGSRLHASGQCHPCHFQRGSRVCRHGSQCDFCHYHTGLVRRRPGQRHRARMRLAQQVLSNQPEGEQAEPEGTGAASSSRVTGSAPARNTVSL